MPGKRFFEVTFQGPPETDDLMIHDAYAFWFEAHEIQWDFGDGQSTTFTRTSASLNYDHHKYRIESHDYAQNGAYTVSFKVQSMAGCTLLEVSDVVEIAELDDNEEVSCENLEIDVIFEDLPFTQDYRFSFTHNLTDLTQDEHAIFDSIAWKFDDFQLVGQEVMEHTFRTNGRAYR